MLEGIGSNLSSVVFLLLLLKYFFRVRTTLLSVNLVLER